RGVADQAGGRLEVEGDGTPRSPVGGWAGGRGGGPGGGGGGGGGGETDLAAVDDDVASRGGDEPLGLGAGEVRPPFPEPAAEVGRGEAVRTSHRENLDEMAGPLVHCPSCGHPPRGVRVQGARRVCHGGSGEG